MRGRRSRRRRRRRRRRGRGGWGRRNAGKENDLNQSRANEKGDAN